MKKETQISNQAYDQAHASEQARAIERSTYLRELKRAFHCDGAARQYGREARRTFAIDAASAAVRKWNEAGQPEN